MSDASDPVCLMKGLRNLTLLSARHPHCACHVSSVPRATLRADTRSNNTYGREGAGVDLNPQLI